MWLKINRFTQWILSCSRHHVILSVVKNLSFRFEMKDRKGILRYAQNDTLLVFDEIHIRRPFDV